MTPAERLAFEKGLPANLDAEQLVLGTCIVGDSVPPVVLDLPASDFSIERHRLIFRVILALHGLQRPIEYATVAEVLDSRGELDKVGIAELAGLSDGMPVLDSIHEYVRIVREKAVLRRLAFLGQSITQHAIDQERPDDIIEDAKARLDGLNVGEVQQAVNYTLSNLDSEYQEHADNIDERRIRLGLGSFDELTGGVAFGEVVTIIARTGVGKSALAQNFIDHVLRSYADIGVVFFSIEMPRLQAFERQLQIYSGVHRELPQWAYRNADKGKVRADEFVNSYGDRFLIVDDARLDLSGLRRFVRGAVAAKIVRPVRFIVIDYLGLLDRGDRRANLTERVSVLAREVKQVAKELEAVVLLIAQTSRSAGDGSQEVTVIDARDSGAIEDSADFLLGAWRPELKKDIGPEEYANVRGDLCFSILKNRRGPRNRFTVHFDAKTLRIGGTHDDSEQDQHSPVRQRLEPVTLTTAD